MYEDNLTTKLQVVSDSLVNVNNKGLNIQREFNPQYKTLPEVFDMARCRCSCAPGPGHCR